MKVFMILVVVVEVAVSLNATTDADCDVSTEFVCLSGECIPSVWRCDGQRDCPHPDESDEKNCTVISCGEGDFQCHGDSACIPQGWLCDSEWDCNDGSDEMNSTCSAVLAVSCAVNEFTCPGDILVCIPGTWVCDREDDCGNGGDELGCSPNRCDQQSEFQCVSDSTCIPNRWHCDEDEDCSDGSDEADNLCQNDRMCPNGTLHCSNGDCIPIRWWCDGDQDCQNGMDEADCEPLTCESSEFHCSVSDICISHQFVCDGDNDCSTGEDEMDCPVKTCSSDEFVCQGDKTCIPRRWFCDQEDDCDDSSDEDADICGQLASPSCSSAEVTCNDDTCIPVSWHCDGEIDCSDGSDELNCELITCTAGSFICDDGTCKAAASRCNGMQDCSDNSDEMGCPECSFPDFFQCQFEDDSCLEITQVCDGVDDCLNGEDENECTVQPCSDDNGGCGARMCINVPNGYYCDCGSGYEFTLYGCQDVDECLKSPDPCPGILCTNLQSNYTCACPNVNYIFDKDGHTCIYVNSTQPNLLVALDTSIRLLDVLHREPSVYAGPFKSAVGISYDPDNGSVYVGDVVEQHIQRITVSSDGDDVNIQHITDVGHADGIAFDWIYRNIYWTDSASDTISASLWDGRFKKVLISEHLDEPRAIVLDPAQGYMYWSDWGSEPFIGRATLDGQSIVTLVSEDVQWINGLALDYQFERLYWVDARLCRIESINLDGSNRYVVHQCSDAGNMHFFGLVVFQDTLYFSDWTLQAVHSVNKFNGENFETLFTFHETPKGLTLTQGFYEVPNLCVEAGSPCSHLCLRSITTPQGYVCACPANTTLAADQHTCLCGNGNKLLEDGISCADENECLATPDPCPGLICVNARDGPSCRCPENYHVQEKKTGTTCLFSYPTPPSMLVADLQLVKGVNTQLTTLESAVGRFSSATALAYDSMPGNEAIYVSDNVAGTITRIEYINKEEGNSSVIVSDAGPVFGLAFEFVQRYLYWSDSRQGTISVTTWDGGYSKVLVTRETGTGIPRALVVVPENGYMYWTDFRPRQASIWRAGLDGSNPEQIVTTSLQRPVSLALQPSEDSMYWVDAGLRHIEMAKSDGSHRRVLLKQGLRRPFGIAVYQDKVYWTDGGKSALLSANRFSGKDVQVVIGNLKRPLGVVVAVKADDTIPNSCKSGGNICSHFCLGTPKAIDQQGFICACPGDQTRLTGSDLSLCVCLNGSHLHKDGIRCQKPGGDCQRDEFHCQNDGSCIPLQNTCDGHIQCTDGSDEECEGGCGNWGYQCSSGSCIPLYLRCDGVPGDCVGDDYEDELNCEFSEDLDWCSATDPIPCPGVECLNLLNGPQCICPMSYILGNDGRTCSFAFPTFPWVLVASHSRIISVDTLQGRIQDVAGDWGGVLSVVYDFDSGFMFVYDSVKNSVERFSTTGGFFGDGVSASNRTVLSSSTNMSEGLAYDWIYRNVYWVNTDEGCIQAQPFDGRYPFSVVLGNLDMPRAIAVDPKERYMYWTDWGANPMIGKAGLDGSNPSKLVNTEIFWPNGLALDYQARRVYWVDSKVDRMEYIGFDGDGRRVIIQDHYGIMHPFGIAIYQDKVFWGDWMTYNLYTANKFTGEVLETIALGRSPMFISVIREYEPHFRAVNYCDGQHGCSHLCLPSPSSATNYTCACPHTAKTHMDPTSQICLCNGGKQLPRDDATCEVEADKDVGLPLRVHGLSSQYLAQQVNGTFELHCTTKENVVMCIPKGTTEESVVDVEGQNMSWSCEIVQY